MTDADPPNLATAARQPFRTRLAIWMACGAALGLPVDDLFGAIDLQGTIARRTLGRRRLRWTLAERLRLADHLRRIPMALRDLITWIRSPDACLAWLKRYQQRRANSREEPKRPGRPWLRPERVQAILQIYDAGCTGLSRIVGEMAKCGMTVAESTVRKVLNHHGRAPTSQAQRRGLTWEQFWKLHAHRTVGADLLQIPIGLFGKIVNAFVFCAIEHDTRRVSLLGITTNPTDAWCANAIRSATMAGEPLATRKHWILDNDAKFGPQTSAVLGKGLVHTSLHAPDMNAFIERFFRSIQEECLNHVVCLSQSHLHYVVTEYLRHYNTERPHQGIGNVTIGPWQVGNGDMVCDESLHGLLKSFRRAA